MMMLSQHTAQHHPILKKLLPKDHCPDAHYYPPQPRRTLIVTTTTTIATSKAPPALTTASFTARIPFEALSIVTNAASNRLLCAHAAHAAAEPCIVTAKPCWWLLVQAGSRWCCTASAGCFAACVVSGRKAFATNNEAEDGPLI
jgi:hypothetical protein